VFEIREVGRRLISAEAEPAIRFMVTLIARPNAVDIPWSMRVGMRKAVADGARQRLADRVLDPVQSRSSDHAPDLGGQRLLVPIIMPKFGPMALLDASLHVAHTTTDALRNTCAQAVDLVGVAEQVVPHAVGDALGEEVVDRDRLVMAPHSHYQFQGTIEPVDVLRWRQPGCGV